MRRHVVAAAKRFAGVSGSVLHRAGGRRSTPGFGILLYHRVTSVVAGLPAPTWNVTPRQFRRQLEGLLEAGYRVWPLRRLIEHAECGGAIPEKVTAITFDDGYQNTYGQAWPVLDELSVPATVFVATAYMGSQSPFPFDDWGTTWHTAAPAETWRPLRWGECRAMETSGLIEIGTHTHTHRDFREVPAVLHADLERSRRALDDHLGPRQPLFAFPYGAPEVGFADPDQLQAARAAGVRCALTTRAAMVRRGSSPFGWGRFEVTADDSAATLAAKLAGYYDWVSGAKRWFVRWSPPPYLGSRSAVHRRAV